MKKTVSDSFHSGLRAASGSFLLAFKWLPYKSGAASMYEQVWQCQMWPATVLRAESIPFLSVSVGSSCVVSPVPSEVFSASKTSSLLFICLSDVWSGAPSSDLYSGFDGKKN